MSGANFLALRTTRITLLAQLLETLSASVLEGNQTLRIPRILLAPESSNVQRVAI